MKNKLFSIFTALAMVLGILVSPFTSAHAADEVTETTAAKVTKTVTLHKLVMNKTDLGKWDSDALEKAGYNGTQDTKAFLELLNNAEHSAEEVEGVYFAFKNSEGKYVTIKEEDGKAPIYGTVDSLDEKCFGLIYLTPVSISLNFE